MYFFLFILLIRVSLGFNKQTLNFAQIVKLVQERNVVIHTLKKLSSFIEKSNNNSYLVYCYYIVFNKLKDRIS